MIVGHRQETEYPVCCMECFQECVPMSHWYDRLRPADVRFNTINTCTGCFKMDFKTLSCRAFKWLSFIVQWRCNWWLSRRIYFFFQITLVPTERRCQVTAGVAKQANTSSVLLKWVTCGLATAWPRHWPHIRTCPLCVLAADVWLVWHAATSTILQQKKQRLTTVNKGQSKKGSLFILNLSTSLAMQLLLWRQRLTYPCWCRLTAETRN